MAATICTHCSAGIPAEARFCPRCGHATPGRSPPGRPPAPRTREAPLVAPAPRAADALPSKSRMPAAGILFLAAAVLGPTMIAAGLATGIHLLTFAGVATAMVLILLLLVGLVC